MNTLNEELDDDTTYAKEALICEIGDKLQSARLEKSLTHDDVIEELKLNLSFLEALEAGNWSKMPGDIYALGFLKQYAALLEIDVSEDIHRIKTNKYELTKPITYPDAPISPNRTWFVSAILLFFLFIIVANLFDNAPNQNIHASNQDQSITQSAAQTITDSYSHNAIIASTSNYAQIITTQDGYSTELDGDEPSLSIKKEAEISMNSFSFFAITDDVWMQVYQAEANQKPKLLREVYLKMSERFVVDSHLPILLTAGNPVSLEVAINGNIVFAQGTLGHSGKVLKLFPISP